MTEAQPYSNAYQIKEYFSDIFYLKTKLLTFHHHRTDADFSSVLMQGYDLKVDPYFERFGASNSFQTSRETFIYDPSRQTLDRRSATCAASERSLTHQPVSIFTRVSANWNLNIRDVIHLDVVSQFQPFSR